MSSQEENQNLQVTDDAVEDTNIDAEAEDARVDQKSDKQQLRAEAADLDTSNIIDDSPGVTTRHAKVDATRQVCLLLPSNLLSVQMLIKLVSPPFRTERLIRSSRRQRMLTSKVHSTRSFCL